MKDHDLLSNLWTGLYHVGPAPKWGIWKARDHETAILVAAAWCQKNGYRAPAMIKPMVLADESILTQTFNAQVGSPLPDAMEATTNAQTFSGRNR